MNNTVAKYLRLCAKNNNPKDIFVMDSDNGIELFTILGIDGHAGRPSKGSGAGTGCRTHTVIRNNVTGRKSTVLLATLLERNVRKVANRYTKHL